ncbi:MAG: putative zinc-binding metallopeptidase [Steroidobacterales bacterium]
MPPSLSNPRRRSTPRVRRLPWTRLSDEQLLRLRMCDLRLDLRRSPLKRHVDRLYSELNERGIRFRPHVWLSEEWFSPDGVPGIAVPFYLAHPRLMRLERKMTREVEGGNANWFMRILRHEAGHAFDSAYRLRRRAHWRTLFGPASRPYRSRYRARPASRHHVQHLGEWYAQSHPTEDFAETFAVWLAPRSGWQRRYASWPALRKLRFVQQFAGELGAHRPPVRCRARVDPLEVNQRTLAQHYRNKRLREHNRRGLLADRLLARVFGSEPGRRELTAATLLRSHKACLRSWVIRDTEADRYVAHQILRIAIERSVRLRLYVRGAQRQALRAVRTMLRSLARLYMRSPGLRLRA